MTFAMNDTMMVTLTALTARVTTAHLRVNEVDDRLEHIAKHLGGDSGAEEDGGLTWRELETQRREAAIKGGINGGGRRDERG